jgi:hypothetical protein
MVHVVYQGRGRDLEFGTIFSNSSRASMGEGNITVDNVTETQMRRALANHFDVRIDEFNDHVVEKMENGDISVHPSPTFG